MIAAITPNLGTIRIAARTSIQKISRKISPASLISGQTAAQAPAFLRD